MWQIHDEGRGLRCWSVAWKRTKSHGVEVRKSGGLNKLTHSNELKKKKLACGQNWSYKQCQKAGVKQVSGWSVGASRLVICTGTNLKITLNLMQTKHPKSLWSSHLRLDLPKRLNRFRCEAWKPHFQTEGTTMNKVSDKKPLKTYLRNQLEVRNRGLCSYL